MLGEVPAWLIVRLAGWLLIVTCQLRCVADAGDTGRGERDEPGDDRDGCQH
jgi:hypothetical protein